MSFRRGVSRPRANRIMGCPILRRANKRECSRIEKQGSEDSEWSWKLYRVAFVRDKNEGAKAAVEDQECAKNGGM